MWSNQYNYLNICKDNLLSEYYSTLELVSFISEISELELYGNFNFKNKSTFPFMQLQLLNAKNIDSWSEKDTGSKTNLITIVCTKEKDDFEKVEKILIKIASFLKWNIIKEKNE